MQNSKVKISNRLKLIKGSAKFSSNENPERQVDHTHRHSLSHSERIFTPSQRSAKQIASSRRSLPLPRKNIANERLRNLRTSILTSVSKNIPTQGDKKKVITDDAFKNVGIDNVKTRQKQLNNSFDSPVILSNVKRKYVSLENDDYDCEHVNKILRYSNDHSDVSVQEVNTSQYEGNSKHNGVGVLKDEISSSKFSRFEHNNISTSGESGRNIANDRLKKIRNSMETTNNSSDVECMNVDSQIISFDRAQSSLESRLNIYNTENHFTSKLCTQTSYGATMSSSNMFGNDGGIERLHSKGENSDEYTAGNSNSKNNNFASLLLLNNIVSKSDSRLDNIGNSFDKFKNQTIIGADTEETSDDLIMITDSPDEEGTSSHKTIVSTISAEEKLHDICIVVDTNIFLHNLKVVKEIINLPISGNQKPIIYVPWMVFTELDFIKGDNSNKPLSRSAQTAICYINSLLQAENCRIKGETVFEANNQIMIGKSADDKIIASCLQASQKYETVILLSNDVNAKNKAIVNHILGCSHNEIIIKLHGLLRNRKNKKFLKIEHKMNLVCSYVICECAKDAYGDAWSEMDLLKSKPWSLLDCMKIFKKYWRSVFSDKLMKQFQQAVDDLIILLERKNSVTDDSEDFKNFTNISAAICIFLKDIDSVRSMMEKTVKEILVLQKS